MKQFVLNCIGQQHLKMALRVHECLPFYDVTMDVSGIYVGKIGKNMGAML